MELIFEQHDARGGQGRVSDCQDELTLSAWTLLVLQASFAILLLTYCETVMRIR
jgi:hypothetical protein